MSRVSGSYVSTSSRSASSGGEASGGRSEERSEGAREWFGTGHRLSSAATGSVTSEAHASRHESDKVYVSAHVGKRLVIRMGRGPGHPIPKKAKEEVAAEGTEEVVETQQKNQHGKTSAAALGEASSVSPAPPTGTPPARLRVPPFPKSRNPNAVRRWHKECSRIWELIAQDPRRNLPTQRKPKNQNIPNSIQIPRDKDVLLDAARSIVSVAPITQDESWRPQCSGIIVQQDQLLDGRYSTFIVTCSRVVCNNGRKLDPLPKLSVCLPDKKTTLDAELMYFNDHYDIAVLSLSLDVPVQVAPVGSVPEYGQDVFVLARDENSSLMAKHGKILCLEESNFLGRSHYMFLSCEVPEGGTGGSVIDHDGKFVGMSFHHYLHPAVLSFSTICSCVSMFLKFGYLARPVLGLAVRTIAMMDIQDQEDINLDFGIGSGLIIDKVSYGSDAEKLGIKHGDVIISLDGHHALTLPELEDYLLSLGRTFLEDKSTSMTYLKLRVFNAVEHVTQSFSLPIRFCVISEKVDSVSMPKDLMGVWMPKDLMESCEEDTELIS
ncbi:hypothetical protein ACP4OV_026094 [Aristida adscensionis]